jgi:hypothetical protein
MQNSIETAGVVDGLLVPHDIPVLAATGFPVRFLFNSFLPFIALCRWNDKDQSENWTREKMRLIKRQDIFERNRWRDAEESDQFVKDIGIGLEGNEVFLVNIHLVRR